MSTFLSIMAVFGWIIAGGLSTFGILDSQKRSRREDEDKVAQNLITNLKLTTEEQDKTIKKMQADIAQHTKERDVEMKELAALVNHLQGRNSILEELFKGRNPKLDEFFKEAPSIFEITKENNEMSKSMQQSMKILTETMSDFLIKVELLIPKVILQNKNNG